MLDQLWPLLFPFLRTPCLGAGLREDTADLHREYPLFYAYTATLARAAENFPALADRLRVLVASNLTELRSAAERARVAQIPYDALGYALERDGEPGELADLVGAVQAARETADGHGKELLLGLGGQLADDNRHYWYALAPLCDYWLLQAQRHQIHPPGPVFRREVRGRTRELRIHNPQVQVIAQVSVTPGPDKLDAATVYQYVRWLKATGLAAVSIFDGRDSGAPRTLAAVLAMRYPHIPAG